jgi:hypothetical protein
MNMSEFQSCKSEGKAMKEQVRNHANRGLKVG